MLGVLITLAFCVGMIGLGKALFGRWLSILDPAAQLGMAGMFGLATVGTLTLLIGLLPNGLGWSIYLIALIGLAGLGLLIRSWSEFWIATKPNGVEWAFLAAIAIGALFALVAVLAPSDSLDWDTLSHHLASVKVWIQNGKVTHIPFMHQSNFPFAVDNLYIWGLQWGGAAAAKAFSLAFLILGATAILGLARQLYSRQAAWWPALLFATVPVILWESGTAYIDVAHGLFAGLAILFACRSLEEEGRSWIVLAGLSLGFAIGTKYTGLQTLFAVGIVLLIAGFKQPGIGMALKRAATIAILALAIGCPWYIKNQIWNGNPVYPFFFSVFGGQNWDERRAEIYQNEQRTFGEGRKQNTGQPSASIDPMSIGNAVLGLSYQPGRYINGPAVPGLPGPGQSQGMGEPLGAVGAATIGASVLVALYGRRKKWESAVLGAVGVSLLMWFVLSQQSRYIITIVPPIAILAGGVIGWMPAGLLLRIVIAGQAAFSLWLVKTRRFDAQILPVAGKVSSEDYQTVAVPFYEPSRTINEVAANGKVALYDEVFGYFLDVPYIWANPGHSLIIPYDQLQNGSQFADELKRQGFTHVYLTLPSRDRDPDTGPLLASMGLIQGPPLTELRTKQLRDEWQTKWKVLLAEAVREGRLTLIKNWGGKLLFEVR